jgi:hypothetical protein
MGWPLLSQGLFLCKEICNKICNIINNDYLCAMENLISDIKTFDPIHNEWHDIIGISYTYHVEDDDFVYYFRPVFSIHIIYN